MTEKFQGTSFIQVLTGRLWSLIFFICNFIYLFIYCLLCWLFIAARAFLQLLLSSGLLTAVATLVWSIGLDALCDEGSSWIREDWQVDS